MIFTEKEISLIIDDLYKLLHNPDLFQDETVYKQLLERIKQSRPPSAGKTTDSIHDQYHF